MVHALILLALAIGWRLVLDARSRNVQKRNLERKQKQKKIADSGSDPEYFVYKLSTPKQDPF